MATSTCPTCKSTRFEIVKKSDVKNATFMIYFVQCASCGAVVGTYDARALTLTDEIAKKLGIRI
ncbi:hypothetical protein CBJ89_001975 [Salmonella enterica subsp. enterica serovar Essen]|nr:hypothetical protein [Salmonella enterica]EBZ0012542.1 hypothetical protein [Salmonella enterica subsp. enterica serovar Suberu]ECI7956912.1 hypothetical protein [Salmonella enterica subsp. enterica]EDU3844934.1 hypothetical protein [Salmonella enterica subsp. enterica serovar Essen]